MSKKEKQLRVAGYCRTSTESQRDNASIPYQKECITRFCELNGWKIIGWYVDESKSGSKIEGRDEFERMKTDAKLKKFDLVVPFDHTRLGRNGRDIINSSHDFVNDCGVHVVDTKRGIDTRNPRRVGSYLHAGLAEDERLSILERTKQGKIARAIECGAPTGPPKMWPFGRIWVKAAKKISGQPIGKWVLDEKLAADVASWAERYLAGESINTFALESGWHATQIFRVLKDKSGPNWQQRIQCKELGIDETIDCPIPELLPPDTIAAVHAEMQRRKTRKNTHSPNNKWLLSGYVRCEGCGYSFRGQPDHGRLVYRHTPNANMKSPCPMPRPLPWIKGEVLEENVMRMLFELLGNRAKVEAALEAAIPNLDGIKLKRDEIDTIEKELEKISRGRDSIMGMIEDGDLSPAEAKPRLAKSRERADALLARQNQIRAELEGIATPEQIRSIADGIERSRVSCIPEGMTKKEWAARHDAARYERMTWDEKRSLVQSVFTGKMPDGSEMGIYIDWEDSKKWRITLRGHLLDSPSWFPWSPERWADYHDPRNELTETDFAQSIEPAVTLLQPY